MSLESCGLFDNMVLFMKVLGNYALYGIRVRQLRAVAWGVKYKQLYYLFHSKFRLYRLNISIIRL